MGTLEMPAPPSSRHSGSLAPPAEDRDGSRWSADLVLLSALLVLTMLFGRSFSKFGPDGSDVYPTELFLAAIAVAAVWRCGPRGAFERARGALPVAALLVLWVAAAIATLRGLANHGLSQITHDVGLLEYSVLLPVVAVVVDSRQRGEALMKVLLYASVASALFYAVARFFPDTLDFAPSPDQAAWIYASVAVAYVATRALYGLPLPPWLWPAAVLGLMITATYSGRTGIVAGAAAVAALALTAPRKRRLIAAVVGAAAFAVGLSLAGPVSDGVKSVAFEKPPEHSAGATEDSEPGSSTPVPGGRILEDSFDPNASGGDQENANWRLEFWQFMLEGTVKQPLFGVGFGRPAAFEFDGQIYDARRGDPTNIFDYTGPHNSFVNILYRTGALGALALLALIAAAARRIRPWRDGARPRAERATLAQLVFVFIFVSAIAFFNVVLEGPQMGLFFWLPLGLLLVLPVVWTREPPPDGLPADRSAA